jgi:hypothetical protein
MYQKNMQIFKENPISEKNSRNDKIKLQKFGSFEV